MRIPLEKLPLEKLPVNRDEFIAAVVTALFVGAFEKIGEKAILGLFWCVFGVLKFSKNHLILPMVRYGEKVMKGCLAIQHKEPPKPVVNKSSGFYCFTNSSLFWAVQAFTAQPPAGDGDSQEPKPGEENSEETKPQQDESTKETTPREDESTKEKPAKEEQKDI